MRLSNGQGRGASSNTSYKIYYTGWRRSNRTFAPEFFLNGVFNLFTPNFFELFPDVCAQAVKYVAVGKVLFRRS